MTRQIKFRAWDKLDKKMYYDVGLSLIGVQVYKDPHNQPPEEIMLDRGRDCFEIMQYTGLLDCNGKEIYEGDVLEIHIDACRYSSIGGFTDRRVVKWDESRNGWNFTAGRNYKCQIHHDEELLDTIEIIGNIYENPDLLTKE